MIIAVPHIASSRLKSYDGEHVRGAVAHQEEVGRWFVCQKAAVVMLSVAFILKLFVTGSVFPRSVIMLLTWQPQDGLNTTNVRSNDLHTIWQTLHAHTCQ